MKVSDIKIVGCYNEKNNCYNVLFCKECLNRHEEIECEDHREIEEMELLYINKLQKKVN